MGVAQGATVHIANTSFNGNIGTPTISNGGKIVWTCQLGFYKPQTGDYGWGSVEGAAYSSDQLCDPSPSHQKH